MKFGFNDINHIFAIYFRGQSTDKTCVFCVRSALESQRLNETIGYDNTQQLPAILPGSGRAAFCGRAQHNLNGVRPWNRTGLRGGFDRLPGVVTFELRWG
jgi:hypothetical protein